MKGPSVFISLFVITLIASNFCKCEALTLEETCQVVKNNTYIGDPSSCQKWALCRDGKPISGKCNDGYLFDSANGVCDYPENVACTSDVNSMCVGQTDVYKADPNNCQNYCYCKDGKTYTESCPKGQFFDPTTISCIWAEKSTCVINSHCVLAPNGFIKDDRSCNGWIRCGSGQILGRGKCPEGYLFNANTGICDYPKNVQCGTSETTPKPIGPAVPEGICRDGKTFYSDKMTCRGYFFCKDSNAEGQWGQCPKNSQFDEISQKCIDPDKVVCPYDRCDGVDKPFMAKANTNCKSYFNCKNGVKYGEGNCPVDYPYFNELASVCQSAVLPYIVCE